MVVLYRALLSLSCVLKTEVSAGSQCARIVGTMLLFSHKSQFLNTQILGWWSVGNPRPSGHAQKTCKECCSQVKPAADL